MGIKKLKSENKFLSLTIGDVLAKADPSKTKKYTQFLVRILEKQYSEALDEFKNSKSINLTSPFDKMLKLDSLENLFSRFLLIDSFFNKNKMDDFVSFCELMEKGLVEEKDISKYDSWEMLQEEYFKAKNRDLFKKSKKDIHKIYEDERYLVLKPLSYMASVSYGYQTKWCTAMVNDNSYFYSHSQGILIYVIDKIENKKVAFHTRFPEPYEISDSTDNTIFNVWNAEDKRIDSFQSELPYEIIKIISMEMDTKIETNLPNYMYFSDEEKQNMRDAGFCIEPCNEEKVSEEYSTELVARPIRVMPRFRRLLPESYTTTEGPMMEEQTEIPDITYTVTRREPQSNITDDEALNSINETLKKLIDEMNIHKHENQHNINNDLIDDLP